MLYKNLFFLFFYASFTPLPTAAPGSDVARPRCRTAHPIAPSWDCPSLLGEQPHLLLTKPLLIFWAPKYIQAYPGQTHLPHGKMCWAQLWAGMLMEMMLRPATTEMQLWGGSGCVRVLLQAFGICLGFGDGVGSTR